MRAWKSNYNQSLRKSFDEKVALVTLVTKADDECDCDSLLRFWDARPSHVSKASLLFQSLMFLPWECWSWLQPSSLEFAPDCVVLLIIKPLNPWIADRIQVASKLRRKTSQIWAENRGMKSNHSGWKLLQKVSFCNNANEAS